MKFLDRITLTIFSDIMLILSIIVCVLIFGWLDFNLVSDLCHKAITTELPSQIILVCCIIFILLALKSIFFSSSDKEERTSQGVMLENEKGKLMISQETLKNLVVSTANGFEGAEEVSARVSLDKENKLIVYINLIVKPNVVIKELSANIQEKVKTKIKQTTDLDVNEVDIKVKNIAPKLKEASN